MSPQINHPFWTTNLKSSQTTKIKSHSQDHDWSSKDTQGRRNGSTLERSRNDSTLGPSRWWRRCNGSNYPSPHSGYPVLVSSRNDSRHIIPQSQVTSLVTYHHQSLIIPALCSVLIVISSHVTLSQIIVNHSIPHQSVNSESLSSLNLRSLWVVTCPQVNDNDSVQSKFNTGELRQFKLRVDSTDNSGWCTP